MREDQIAGETAGDALALQALLYASGELDEAQLPDFEQRLGEDQGARDALCQAVQMTLALKGQLPARPNPAYRERVRQRLQTRQPWWQAVADKRAYRGHPALWSGLGAAAAVLLMIGLGQLTHVGSSPQVVVQPGAIPVAPPKEPSPAENTAVAAATPEEAHTWAELTNSNHLEKAHNEEARRKNRAEELQRLVKNKADDRRNRVLGKSARP